MHRTRIWSHGKECTLENANQIAQTRVASQIRCSRLYLLFYFLGESHFALPAKQNNSYTIVVHECSRYCGGGLSKPETTRPPRAEKKRGEWTRCVAELGFDFLLFFRTEAEIEANLTLRQMQGFGKF